MKMELETYYPFIEKKARKWSRVIAKSEEQRREIFQDLYHEGLLALYQCKSRFDPSQGAPFMAFARRRIEGAMVDFIRRSFVVKMPQGKVKQAKEFRLAKARLFAELGRAPRDDEIVACLGISMDELLRLERYAIFASVEFEDRRSAEQDTAWSRYERQKLAADVDDCLNGLSTEQKLILLARKENITLKILGVFFAKSLETIRRREMDAKSLLKACLEKFGWSVEDFL